MAKRIGITGHRPERVGGHYNFGHPVWRSIQESLLNKYLKYIDDGYHISYNGLAIGFDIIAAQTWLDLKEALPQLQLIAAVPFPGQEDLWTPYDQSRYIEVLGSCDDVVLTSKTKPRLQKDATRLFLERNDTIIDNADILICLWDKMHYGGTWDAIQKAQAKGIPIDYIYVGDHIRKG